MSSQAPLQETTDRPPKDGTCLEVEGLGIAYGDRRILADIGFRVPQPGITVVLGPSGTGKSSLLYWLSGQPAPARRRDAGTAILRGRPLADAPVPPALLRQKAQDLRTPLGELLAADLRASSPASPAGARADLVQRLHALGLASLESLLDQPLAELALAEQRLANLLRVALSASPLLLIDEPTSGLPGGSAARVLDLLQRLGRDRALLVVTHNLAHARQIADHAILLAGGRVQVEATADLFFRNAMQHPVLAQYLRTGSCSVPGLDTPSEHLDGSGASGDSDGASASGAALEAVAAGSAAGAMDASGAEAGHAAQSGPGTADDDAARPPAPASAPAPVPAPALAPAPAAQLEEPPAAAGLIPATSGIQPVPDALPDGRGPSGFHWLIPGRLAGCPKPGVIHPVDHDLQLLKRMGITTLVNLTEYQFPPEPLARHGLKGFAMHIEDRRAPPLMWLKMLLSRMERLMLAGESLAVHCHAGLGRTGTILCGWLVREGLTAEEALRRVRMIDAGFVQSREQELLLHELEANLLIRAS